MSTGTYPDTQAPLTINQMVLAIVQDEDAPALSDAVVSRGYAVTRMATVGSFLRAGNSTLLIGINDRHLIGLIYLIREHCRARIVYLPAAAPTDLAEPLLLQPLEVEVGGAVVFIIEVERFEQF